MNALPTTVDTLAQLKRLLAALDAPDAALATLDAMADTISAALDELPDLDRTEPTPAEVVASVASGASVALSRAGFPRVAGWAQLLTPVLLDWVAKAGRRPLAGSTVSGTADLSRVR